VLLVTRSELTFRVAVLADVPRVVRLVESAYRGESSRAGWTTEADLLDGQRTDTDAVSDIITTPDRRVLLGYVDGELVACCELQSREGATAYFGMFAVVPTQQGSGIGAKVLAEAERRAAADWGAKAMEMTVIGQRVELIEWYERKGYVRTGETRPFPHGDERFGLPRRDDLEFVVLTKSL
jgi:ribosomal protein S18 acetylase RimI-like enzyme